MPQSRARFDTRQSLDWPLSRDEKRGCVLRLYEADVQAANKLLRSKDKALQDMHKELRRASRTSSIGGGGARPRSSSLVYKREVQSPNQPGQSLSPRMEHDTAGSTGKESMTARSHSTSITSIDLLGIETDIAVNAEKEAILGGEAAASTSSVPPVTSIQAEDHTCREPDVDRALPQAWSAMPIDGWPQEDATEITNGTEKLPRSKAEASDSCRPRSHKKTRSDATSESLLQQDRHKRARSVPMRCSRSVSPVRQESWWAPVVKVFSKALLLDEFCPRPCPRPSTGQRPCREAFPIQFVDFEWHVEMERGEGRDQMRLGLTLQLPKGSMQGNQPLVIAEVLEGFALHKWNSSGFPVTVRVMPGGREAVARRVVVQPGDEIIEIDDEPAVACSNDLDRKRIDQRLKRCTRLTLRRRMQKPGLRNSRSFAQAGGA